jgi:oxygen-independent coproporphyrinogen-3 oxidase
LPTRRPRHLSHDGRRCGDDGDGGGDDSSAGLGLYVHIPYCRRRCNYCDFAIVPVGETVGDDGDDGGFSRIDRAYRDAILDEIEVLSSSSASGARRVIGGGDGGGGGGTTRSKLRSVYFGGGTPSLAPPSTLSAILDGIRRVYDLVDGAEVTIEMDPGTFDECYLEAVRDMGFNRISLGVQSFDDAILETLGRAHRRADVHRSVDMIGDVYGIEDANYSIDLMSGVPGLTLAGWTETLHEAVSLRPMPSHLSLYDLQLEEGTKFGTWYGAGERDGAFAPQTSSSSPPFPSRPALPSSDDAAFMYAYASGYLRYMDYEHYEISSYAYLDSAAGGGDRGRHGRKSNRSRHNQIYWEYNGRWHAVGLGATSNIDGVRYARPRAMSDYISWIKAIKLGLTTTAGGGNADMMGTPPPWLDGGVSINTETQYGEETNSADLLLDIVMTRLRTSEGLDLDWVAEHGDYGKTHIEAILRGFELALGLELGHKDAGTVDGMYGSIRLNDPKGFLFSNHVISNIFMELSELDPGQEKPL